MGRTYEARKPSPQRSQEPNDRVCLPPPLGGPMRALLLTDYGHSLRTRGLDLELFHREDKVTIRYSPKTLGFDTIIAHHLGGFVTWPALRWLGLNGVSLFIIDFNGKPILSALPDYPISGPRRLAQYQASVSPKRCLELGKWLIALKHGEPVPDSVRSITHLLGYEAAVAQAYFAELGVSRDHYTARDSANACLNYCYGVLESRVRIAVHAAGFDPAVGFIHKAQDGKSALVYDLMEPFRRQVDKFALAVHAQTRPSDFYQNYSRGLCLRPETARLIVEKFEADFKDKDVLGLTSRLAHRLANGGCVAPSPRLRQRSASMVATEETPFHGGRVQFASTRGTPA
jgi:CRISPR/Cas system-associated endonuclease Cas1